MIIRELIIDQKTCTGSGCPVKCWVQWPDLFDRDSTSDKAIVIVDTVPVELIPDAEWAIYECWQQDGSGAGSITGRGEPESPPPPE